MMKLVFGGVGYYEVQVVWWLGSTKIMATEKWEDHGNLNKSGKDKVIEAFI